MQKTKKRPSKHAKAAQRLLNESKLLAVTKAAQVVNPGQEFQSSVVTPRTSDANTIRPHKKRG